MGHGLRVAVLVVLCLVLGGSRCGEDEDATLELLRHDVAPAFDYALYCDSAGRLTGKYSDVLLVHRSEHLERVYADTRRGDARARVLFEQLETQAAGSGRVLADQALGLVCTSLPTCTVRWAFLDELIPSHAAGGLRLRHVLARSFEQEARHKGVQNAVINAAVSVLMVGSTVELAETRTLAGEEALQEALTKGLSLEEAAALEARLAEAEALESGARYPALPEELARHRPLVHQPPPGVAATESRWVDYGFLNRFQRALEFQRDVAQALRQDAGLAKGQRHWLRGLEQPIVEENVGLAHEGSTSLTYVDQFVVDAASLRPGQRPSVHSFSNKQRGFKSLSDAALEQQLNTDAQEALAKYGGEVEVRRPGHALFGRKVSVSRVHLVYDGRELTLDVKNKLVKASEGIGVELHFHE